MSYFVLLYSHVLHVLDDGLLVGWSIFDILLIVTFEGELGHEAVECACATKAVLAEGFDANLLVFLKSIGDFDIILIEQLLGVFGSLLLSASRCGLPALYGLAFGQMVADVVWHLPNFLILGGLESIRLERSAVCISLSLIETFLCSIGDF